MASNNNIPVAQVNPAPSDQKLPDPQAGKSAKEVAIEMEVRKFQEGIVQLLQMNAPPRVATPQYVPVMYGNPAALGLAAFATTLFVSSVFYTGMLNDTVIGIALPLALFYGGIVEILAGMWEYAVANTFGATAFISYGAFFLSWAAYIQYVVPVFNANNLGGHDVDMALGVYLLAWFVFTGYMLIGSLKVSRAIFGLFLLLELTLLLAFVSYFAQSIRCRRSAAWVGIFTAGLAWYASAATVINASWRQNLVPTIPYVHAQQGDPYMHGQPADPWLHGQKNVVYAHGQPQGPFHGGQQQAGVPYGQPGAPVYVR